MSKRASELESVLGSSFAMNQVRAKAQRVLEGRALRLPPVLLQGETGTGKGLLARALHAASARGERAFVEVNCSAIPEQLLESELFGFERGAFTDAHKPKPGLFHLADRGTLFLDEVSLLPLHLQPKLLKALEDRAVRRLGSTEPESADVWLIAATNEDLAAAVLHKRFRSDLYHRLAVLPISLPPLRERGDDVLELAEIFLARTRKEYGLGQKQLTADAQAALRGHGFPGNVRELGNAIERGALLAPGERIDAGMLELGPGAGDRSRAPEAPGEKRGSGVDDVLCRHLVDVLGATNWNISRTAATLGITRNTLRARIRKYGLSPEVRERRAAPAAEHETLSRRAQKLDAQWRSQLLAFVQVELGEESSPRSLCALCEAEQKLLGFGARTEQISSSGMVAVFGVEPLEDATRRATLAALTIAHQRTSEGGAALRVAVHAEKAMVRPGQQAPIDHTSQQTAVAALQKLEVARPGLESGVLLSAAAAAFIARDFQLTQHDPDVFVASTARPTTASDGAASTWVGRGVELDLLCDRLRRATAGRAQVLAIVGEPGIGKSRLLRELAQSVEAHVRWVEVRCWSHLAEVPYAAVMDLIRKLAALADSDDAQQTKTKLGAAAAELTLSAAMLTALLELFGFPAASPSEQLAPEARKEAVLAGASVLCSAAAGTRPLVLAFEDVHWLDPTSEECVTALVDALATEPSLVITAQRAGREFGWRHSPTFTQLALPPLTEVESEVVATSIARSSELSAERLSYVLSRAEGNPFFVEELTRSLLQSRAERLPLPQTISEALLFRLRSLPEALRSTVEVAAVLGRQFPRSYLKRLLPADVPLGSTLAELRRLNLLLETATGVEPNVTFRHALTQQVAYEDIPLERRRELHAAAATAIEQAYAHRRDEVIDTVAYHRDHASDPELAIDALLKSAARATHGYALAQASALFRRAELRASEVSAKLRPSIELDIVNRLAHVLCLGGRYADCLLHLRAHEPQDEHLLRPDLIGHFHFWLAYVHSLLGQQTDAERHGRKAITLSRAAGLAALEGRALFVLAREAFFDCRFGEGVNTGGESVTLLGTADDQWWLGQAHWIVGMNYLFMGQIAECLTSERSALSLGESLGDARLRAYAEWTSGFAHACAGAHDLAVAHCLRAVTTSRDPVGNALARGFLGFSLARAGELEAGSEHLAATADELDRLGLKKQGGTFRAFLSDALLAQGDLARAGREANEALATCKRAHFPFGSAWAERALARLFSRLGKHQEALEYFQSAACSFAAIGSELEHARTVSELANVSKADPADLQAFTEEPGKGRA